MMRALRPDLLVPLAVTLLAALAVAQAGDPPQTTERPAAGKTVKKIALLVGLQEYAHPPNAEFGELAGPRNDLGLVQRTLIEELGFAPGDIKVLLDEQATHEAIVRAFDEWLIRRADADTEVLFWFCGHGSRVYDRSETPGAEQDYMEASFLAFDSRTNDYDGEYDIVDDEFHSLLVALTERTSRVTVVTDACFSGGGFRGGPTLAARGVPAGTQPFAKEILAPFWPSDVPLIDDDARSTPQLASRYVHIAACSNQQRAFEIPVEETSGRTIYGAFSYYLVQAIRTAQPGDSIRSIAERASTLVGTHVPTQSVWYEGALDREFLGANFVPRPRGFPAAVRGDDLHIRGGALHGLAVGSILDISASGDKVIGKAKVLRLGASSAIARWQDSPTEQPAHGAALRAVERERPAHVTPLAVAIAEPSLRSALRDNAWITPTAADAADYRLVGKTPKDARLETIDGQPLWTARPLDDALRSEVRYGSLWRLPLQRGALEVSATLLEPTTEELARSWTRRMRPAPLKPGAGGTGARGFSAKLADYNEEFGELAILEVTNEHIADLHIAVLSITETRQIELIWPAAENRDNILPVDEVLRVPVWVGADPQWRVARPMCDRYVIIATERFVDFGVFVSHSRTRGDGPDDATLPGILRQAFAGPRTRGQPHPVTDFRARFGVCSVDLLVERR